jgi:hypothetical protein
MRPDCILEAHDKYGACYNCCATCNYDRHICHFCGESLHHNSTDGKGNRHWLSDCRPDLIDGTYDGGGKTVYTDGPMV